MSRTDFFQNYSRTSESEKCTDSQGERHSSQDQIKASKSSTISNTLSFKSTAPFTPVAIDEAHKGQVELLGDNNGRRASGVRQALSSVDMNSRSNVTLDKAFLDGVPIEACSKEIQVLTMTPASRACSDGADEDLATPLPRRKSFLLSLINSSTRPRPNYATPQMRLSPMNGYYADDTTELGPKRRPRVSQPLAQIHTILDTPKPSHTSSRENNYVHSRNDSFVSTASSHDLTVYHRANASFDPATGAQGVGRFNAGKLNSYLHGLNRRLQEENELLMSSLKDQQRTIGDLQSNRRRELSEVMEIDGAEQWLQEKEEMERATNELKYLLERKESELRDERIERQQDKDKWKGRLAEVEEGVGDIIRDLEKRATSAEQKVEELRVVETQLQDTQSDQRKAERECQDLRQRLEKAEASLESIKRRPDLIDGILGKGILPQNLQSILATNRYQMMSYGPPNHALMI